MEFNRLTILEKQQLYISKMRPVLDKRALFSDETVNFRTPLEPDFYENIVIRFRTGKHNVDNVYLVCETKKYRMEKYISEEAFDYYRIQLELTDKILKYYFEIHAGELLCYYNKKGVCKELPTGCLFGIVPGFKTPEWAKGAVMYQIYTDRFYNGDPSNDVEDREYIYIKEGTSKVDNWFKHPAIMGVREFYGGDIQGVWDKLDYLEKLGVEVLYFNPLFVSPSNHKYDIQDYDYIDPHLGVILYDGGEALPEGDNDNSHASKYIARVTDKRNLEASNRFFIRFIEEVHRRGMRVILDGVFNHCGSFNKWLDRERIYELQDGYEKGAYISGESPYRSFFRFKNEGVWPYNSEYDGWWGHNTLPKLNFEESRALHDYIMDVARKWVSPPFNADGWRLDVAADLGHSNEYNHEFWKEFRKVVKQGNPDALILAEHYGDARDWLQGDEWDTVMNYDAFMEPITWFLTGMEKHSDEYHEEKLGNAEQFVGAMTHHMASFYAPALQVAMNELSNHDHSRFLTRTNHKVGRVGHLGSDAADEDVNKGIFREAIVMQMTWPGAPTLYYGDEAGLCGFTDPDNRRTYPWGREDWELIEFYREMIRIHKENKVFARGSVKFLCEAYNVISYGRFDNREQVVVAVNNNHHSVAIEIPVWEIRIPKRSTLVRLMLSLENYYNIGVKEYIVENGYLNIELPPISAIVLKRKHLAVPMEEEVL